MGEIIDHLASLTEKEWREMKAFRQSNSAMIVEECLNKWFVGFVDDLFYWRDRMEKYRLIKELVDLHVSVDKIITSTASGEKLMLLQTSIAKDIHKAVDELLELDKEKK